MAAPTTRSLEAAPRLVYVTCKDRDEAANIAKNVIGRRLAACANIVPQVDSFYWWDGEVAEDQECVLLFKTTAANVDALIGTVERAHSYDTPAVVALPILQGSAPYLNWLRSEVQPAASAAPA